jgi:hypothetical protein
MYLHSYILKHILFDYKLLFSSLPFILQLKHYTDIFANVLVDKILYEVNLRIVKGATQNIHSLKGEVGLRGCRSATLKKCE